MADLGCHFSAHSHPLPGCVDLVDDLFEKPQKSWMQHIGKIGDFGIVSISSEKILVQIVRAKTEEIDLGAELIEDEPGGRNFNHDADVQV